MKLLSTRLLSLCMCLSAVSSVCAVEHAFRFDTQADFKKWVIASNILKPLEPCGDYPAFSKYSLRFSTPKWVANTGMPEWPSCEAKPIVKDWSGFDRIAFDITNPNPERQRLSLFISDSKIPFRKALGGTFDIPGNCVERFELELKKFPGTVNRKDISIVHLFTQRPEADMDIYIGNVMLLKKGEKAPELPKNIVQSMLRMVAKSTDAVYAVAQDELAKVEKLCDVPELKDYVEQARKDIAAQIAACKAELQNKDMTMDQLKEFRVKLENMPGYFKRMPVVLEFIRNAVMAGQDTSSLVVGTASSMVKILPRDMPFEVDVERKIELSLARNEWESAQIVVMPSVKDAKNVKVTLSKIVNDKGETLEGADADIVGYVKTPRRPPYKVSYVGWWPDPILRGRREGQRADANVCESVDVARGDVQSFWLRFRAGKTQAAGIYRGTATVQADGVKPIPFEVTIRVRNFQVPDNTALPTAITFGEVPHLMSKKISFDAMKLVYADFLADYQIDYDHLYRHGAPDWNVIQHLHKQGRLTAFNLGNVFNGGVEEKGFEQKMQQVIDRLRPAYEKAKELGLLEYAYIYGFDERGKDQFPILERCAQALRKAFPEVLLMTTSYDHSFGADTVVKTMDAWCPLTPRFDIPKAEAARRNGKYVWWYICCGPHNPHTNWFVEYAAIESRLLMGAQTVKFRPDGFLYYHTSIWNDNKGIDCAKGPFTDWNPISWTTYHGDGSLFHCDKDGYPLPSIRLENYRDGQEDYAYACILEEAIRVVKARKNLTDADKKWLEQADAAMVVPEELVVDMATYSRDPKVLNAWRDRIADAIEASGLSDLNPWKSKGVFGVRGWRK